MQFELIAWPWPWTKDSWTIMFTLFLFSLCSLPRFWPWFTFNSKITKPLFLFYSLPFSLLYTMILNNKTPGHNYSNSTRVGNSLFPSFCSFKKSDWSKSLFTKRVKKAIRSQKNKQFARKTKERIPNPDYNPMTNDPDQGPCFLV